MGHSVLWVSSVGEGGHKIRGARRSQGLSSEPVLCGGDGSALWRAGKQRGDQVEFIKQQRAGEAGG